MNLPSLTTSATAAWIALACCVAAAQAQPAATGPAAPEPVTSEPAAVDSAATAPATQGAAEQGASTPPRSSPWRGGGGDAFSTRYGVIAQRNIFLRDRVRPRDNSRENTTTRSTQPAPLTPEQAFVLRGIVLEEGDLRAYFEDKRTGAVTRIATGATLAEGRVAEIGIDAVRFQNDGALTWVEIGHDLTGSRSASTPTGTGGSTSSGGSSAATPAAPGGGAAAPGGAAPTDPSLLSIEERMRLRRLQSGRAR
ncbi:MAG TPA: hypothetical protein VF624_03365 [Tepidisphaeraceae bacterium]|jgi:hypothetical protein